MPNKDGLTVRQVASPKKMGQEMGLTGMGIVGGIL